MAIFFTFLLLFGLQVTLRISLRVTEPLRIVARSLTNGLDAGLVEAARRIAQGAPPGAWVPRLGGDEFSELIEEVAAADQALIIAQSIINLMRKPFITDTTTILMPASIGVAVGPVGTPVIGELLRHADIALYDVKGRGKQGCVLFDEAMNQTVMQRIELEMSLRHALDRSEFEATYQPIVSLNRAKWCRSKRSFAGTIPPRDWSPRLCSCPSQKTTAPSLE